MRRKKLLCTPILVALILTTVTGAFAATEKVLYTFTGGSGNEPEDSLLVHDSSGALYGTTTLGGRPPHECGIVFRLQPRKHVPWKETVLHTFTCRRDGAYPGGGVILDASGNIYGTASGGGNRNNNCDVGCGVVFKLSPNGSGGWKESVLYSFTGAADGGVPLAGVIRDASGNLYGTAGGGNVNNAGVAYEISSSGTFSVLYSFCSLYRCADGQYPQSSLTMDAKGNLYGTTVGGGAYGGGIVFELSTSVGGNWTETVLHSFDQSDGEQPQVASLTIAQVGQQTVLFGVTPFGGMACNSYGCGTVFQIILESGFFNVIYNFTGSQNGDGDAPYGTPTYINGKLFGTTINGGTYGAGAVWEMTQQDNNWMETVLFSFCSLRRCKDGQLPMSGVVAGPSGNLYGATYSGGSGYGVVYEVTP